MTARTTGKRSLPILTAALTALKQGWSVLPVASSGEHAKKPHYCLAETGHSKPGKDGSKLVPSWESLQHMPPTPEQVRTWFEDAGGRGVAVVTGSVSRLVVLDFDGEAGRQLLEHLGLQPHVRTGSGGYHVYFEHPGWRVPTLNSKAKHDLGSRYPGLDIRADGGYAVLPPSHNASGPYEALRDLGDLEPLSSLPDELRDFLGVLRAPQAASPTAPRPLTLKPNGHPAARPEVAALLTRALERAAASGRNNGGFWLACQLRDNGYSEAEAREVGERYLDHVSGTNTKGNAEAYTMSEFEASLAQAYRAVPRESWPAGPRRGSGSPPSLPGQTEPAADPIPWPPLTPLPPRLPEAPTLPVEMVPERLRDWLVDTAELACIPLEYVAAPALAGLSGLVGRSIGVKPERFIGWIVTINLWSAIVGRPGMMKSLAVSEALSPLTRLEARAAEQYEVAQREAEIEAELLQAEAASLRSKKGPGLTRDALRDLKQREKDNEVTARRYLVQNATVEKLHELLRDNPRGLTVGRDELASWLHDNAREEKAEALGFFLAAWNGDEPYTIDRIGRGVVRVPHVCVSVVGGIQPGPLGAFIADSQAGSKGDHGLLQRFQLLVCPDSLGPWERPTRRRNHEAKDEAFEIYEALDGLYDPDAERPPVLTFDDEAQAMWDTWRDELENRLRGREFEKAPGFESHLSKYRSLVPSLAALFYLVQVAAPGMTAESLGCIPAEALELALNWAAFLELHARKVYAWELGSSMVGAYAFAEKINKGHIKDGDGTRDLRRKDWAELSGRGFDRALEQMQALNWVRLEDVPTGGAPREVVRLHPDLLKGRA